MQPVHTAGFIRGAKKPTRVGPYKATGGTRPCRDAHARARCRPGGLRSPEILAMVEGGGGGG